jgi:hypothetical protein
VFLPWLLLAVIGIGFVVFLYRLLERRTILKLKWPETVGYYTMSRFVDTYLQYYGWRVHTNRNQMHLKTAQRPGQLIRIVCVPSFLELNASRIKDVCQIALAVEGSPKLHVCITMREVLIVHYQQMHLFKDHRTHQGVLFETMRREQRGALAAMDY